MASYHLQINTGARGQALEHAQYIQREGRYREETYGEVAARGHANMPAWAREDTAAFWRASDEFERANGNTYREYELALPRELSPAARVALVERFAEQEFGVTRPYQWAIHHCTARDGREQPHVHLMFSDRQLDGIERGEEQFFKRYNGKNPERGGARKFSYGADKEEAARTYEGIRERWAKVQNQALEYAGVEARVDHRSLADQGIHTREPQLHRGPAVSGIEARGEVSQVGERQRAQRQERGQERAAVVAEVRVVTREEVAAERVAVCARRELARGVTGEDRAVVLPLVEADRREQLGRAQAAAERRVERRQGLSMGGQLKEKLLTQARALRERIGQQLGRVRAWVQEHFPDPFERVKGLSREVFQTVAQKARRLAQEKAVESPPSLEVERQSAKAPSAKRGRFDGLQLELGDRPPTQGRFSAVRLSVEKSAPDQVRGQAAAALHEFIDRYARAWLDATRMQEKGLPVLEHQKTELKHAGQALETQRPGARQDLLQALQHQPGMRRAIKELEAPERAHTLLAGIEREGAIRRDPNLRAERFVKVWQGLEAQREQLRGGDKPVREQLNEQVREITRELKRSPELEAVLQRRSKELGIEPKSRLARVIQERDLGRALTLSVRELGRDLGQSR